MKKLFREIEHRSTGLVTVLATLIVGLTLVLATNAAAAPNGTVAVDPAAVQTVSVPVVQPVAVAPSVVVQQVVIKKIVVQPVVAPFFDPFFDPFFADPFLDTGFGLGLFSPFN